MSGFPAITLSALLVPLIAGTCLGILFFTALRLTVERALSATPAVRPPAVRPRPFFFVVSFFLRMGTVILAMWLICGSSATTWLSCLAGFTLGKIIVLGRRTTEVTHAHRI